MMMVVWVEVVVEMYVNVPYVTCGCDSPVTGTGRWIVA
jgi:hypothetical protein